MALVRQFSSLFRFSVRRFLGGDAVGELVGIVGGVVSGVINLESSRVEADWRPRHDERYHGA